MIFPQVFKKPPLNQKGIALFIVIAAISVLAILVTEFTYIANVNQSIAFGALDQLKAHYLAKNGFKLALLRLKIYLKVKDMPLPENIKKKIEFIWNYQLTFPVSDHILEMLPPPHRDPIKKFQDDLDLGGFFEIDISSESSKYNLNILSYRPDTPGSTDLAKNRLALETYLGNILTPLFQKDQDLADRQSQLRIADLVHEISVWTNPTYPQNISRQDRIPMKSAPFYDISELHMLPSMNDELFDLLAPYFRTDFHDSEINVNHITQETLQALIPRINNDEIKKFFTDKNQHPFEKPENFFQYLKEKLPYFQTNEAIESFKKNLDHAGVVLTTNHTSFKIRVQAHVNQARCSLEAWIKVHTRNQKNTTMQIVFMRFL